MLYKCIMCNLKYASFEQKALYCGSCKLYDMTDVINTNFIACNSKHASFNYKDEQKALDCGSCKLDDTIDIVNKKCIRCNLKQPIFLSTQMRKTMLLWFM